MVHSSGSIPVGSTKNFKAATKAAFIFFNLTGISNH
jgi:hypothetical protein